MTKPEYIITSLVSSHGEHRCKRDHTSLAFYGVPLWIAVWLVALAWLPSSTLLYLYLTK